MSKKNKIVDNRSSVGTLGMLTICFIILKICGCIDWNWFWVLSPTLLPIILVIVFALSALSLVVISTLIENYRAKQRINKFKK